MSRMKSEIHALYKPKDLVVALESLNSEKLLMSIAVDLMILTADPHGNKAIRSRLATNIHTYLFSIGLRSTSDKLMFYIKGEDGKLNLTAYDMSKKGKIAEIICSPIDLAGLGTNLNTLKSTLGKLMHAACTKIKAEADAPAPYEEEDDNDNKKLLPKEAAVPSRTTPLAHAAAPAAAPLRSPRPTPQQQLLCNIFGPSALAIYKAMSGEKLPQYLDDLSTQDICHLVWISKALGLTTDSISSFYAHIDGCALGPSGKHRIVKDLDVGTREDIIQNFMKKVMHYNRGNPERLLSEDFIHTYGFDEFIVSLRGAGVTLLRLTHSAQSEYLRDQQSYHPTASTPVTAWPPGYHAAQLYPAPGQPGAPSAPFPSTGSGSPAHCYAASAPAAHASVQPAAPVHYTAADTRPSAVLPAYMTAHSVPGSRVHMMFPPTHPKDLTGENPDSALKKTTVKHPPSSGRGSLF